MLPFRNRCALALRVGMDRVRLSLDLFLSALGVPLLESLIPNPFPYPRRRIFTIDTA